uniref:aralkylamine N-acetyltransferase n=1 Tax=Plectus sambesii TaxID=2011161 RepID=A0A914V7T7_9BILA
MNIIMSQDDLAFVRAEEQDYDRILRFLMDHFRVNEPISEAVKLTEEEGMIDCFIPYMVRKSLAHPFSIIVLNGKDEIVAVYLMSVTERGNSHSNSDAEESTTEMTGGAAKIGKFLDHMEDGYWELVPKSAVKLAKLEIISVRGDQTRKGIANKLINLDLENLRNMGCQGIITVASAFNSQNLFLKNEYKILKEVKHEDWRDENDQQIFVCPDNKTNRAILVYKDLL